MKHIIASLLPLAIHLFIVFQERGQVLASLSYTSEENELLQPRVILERRLLEMMLQGSIMDLKESGIYGFSFLL